MEFVTHKLVHVTSWTQSLVAGPKGQIMKALQWNYLELPSSLPLREFLTSPGVGWLVGYLSPDYS